jgi:hypothetical protein
MTAFFPCIHLNRHEATFSLDLKDCSSELDVHHCESLIGMGGCLRALEQNPPHLGSAVWLFMQLDLEAAKNMYDNE